MLQPTNSRSLYLLGDAQLRYYDNDPDTKGVLQEAEDSYRVSIDLEGKSSGGKVVPDRIREQKWFKEKQAKLDAEKKAKETASSPSKVAPGSTKAGMTTAGRGAAPTRGGAAARGGTTSIRGGRTPAATGNKTHCALFISNSENQDTCSLYLYNIIGRGSPSTKGPAPAKPTTRGKPSPGRGASTTARGGSSKPSGTYMCVMHQLTVC